MLVMPSCSPSSFPCSLGCLGLLDLGLWESGLQAVLVIVLVLVDFVDLPRHQYVSYCASLMSSIWQICLLVGL
jgi:hypothetical protein